MKKRFLSLLFAAVMIVTMLPASALVAHAGGSIEDVILQGVTAPAAGAQPSTANISTWAADGYTISDLQWYDVMQGENMSSSSRFQSGRAYILRVKATPSGGYSFAAPEDMTAYIRGVNAEYRAIIRDYSTQPQCRSVDFVFYALNTGPVTQVSLSYVDAPSVGAHPDFSLSNPFDRPYQASHIGWVCMDDDDDMTPSDTFEAGKVYRLGVTFTPLSGYTFAGPSGITALFAGSSSGFTYSVSAIDQQNPAGDGCIRVYYQFDRLPGGSPAISSVTLDWMEMPYVGETFSQDFPIVPASGSDFTVGVQNWYENRPGQPGRLMSDGDVFQRGCRYIAEVQVLPDSGFSFAPAGSMSASVLGIPADRYTLVIRDDYLTPGSGGRVLQFTFDTPSFTDVTDTEAFYYRPVYWAAGNHVTTGWSDGTFRPWNTCNRASIVTFLWRLAGSPAVSGSYPFKDPTGNAEFDRAVIWATQKGIVSGFSDGTFRPWNPCNRASIVTFLYRMAGKPPVSGSYPYSDSTGNAEFDRAITWAEYQEITTGYSDGTFRPWSPCSRAAVAAFLCRAQWIFS